MTAKQNLQLTIFVAIIAGMIFWPSYLAMACYAPFYVRRYRASVARKVTQ